MTKASCLNALLIFSSMIISGCGGGNSVLKKNEGVRQLVEVAPISSDERNIATRICYAYQSKSKNFRSSGFIGKSFNFSGKKTDCQNNISSHEISTRLQYDDNNNLVYAPTVFIDETLKFNKYVQTDTNGYLAQLCPKVVSNQPISNTIDQQNFRVQIFFFRDGFDGFSLQYFVKQPDNTYKVDSMEGFKVRSLIDFTTGKILGMDESYSYYKVCGSQFDKRPASIFEQNFISQ